MLEALGKDDRPMPIKLQILPINKQDKNAANVERLIKALKASKSGKRVGTIPDKGDRAPTSLTTAVMSALKKSGLEYGVDVSHGFASVLAIKDAPARDAITQASEVTTRVFRKFFVEMMEKIIETDKPMTHADFADKVEDVIKDPPQVKLTQYKSDDLDSCYSPIIQSGSGGEKFDLRPSAQSSTQPIQPGSGMSLIAQFGARYKNYCSNIGRTFFINPTKEQKEVYHVLTQVYMACRSAMRPGNKISAIWLAAQKAIQDARRPDLVSKFTKTCGFGMGLEFRESTLVINEKNQRTIQKGMVFNLCVGFSDFVTPASKATDGVARPWAVLIADTLHVAGGPNDEPERLTRSATEFAQVSYEYDQDDSAAAGADEAANKAAIQDVVESDRRRTRGVGKDALRADPHAEETEAKRAAHQQELIRRKQEEALRRLAAGEMEDVGTAVASFDLSSHSTYKSLKDYHPDARMGHIRVDPANQCVLVPINDTLVPFHVSTILKAYKRIENDFTYLTIKFQVPDTKQAREKMKVQHGAHYISELSFRTSSQSLDKPFFDLDQLRKNWLLRMKEQEVKSSLVEQEELRIDRKGPTPILKDINARPQLTRKKTTTGTLTAHLNGLRFVTTEKNKIDIIYGNIKNAFYQPAEEGSHNVTIHFELKNPILLDKSKTKKTNHMQFFVEVVESSEDLSMSSRFRDEDGLAEEQEERRRKKRWNERFLQFVKEVEDKLLKDPNQPKLEFDIPYKELSFTGVPARQQVTIMPTVHSLVALDDNPPMVVNLSEVEIAVFERIQFGLKNFDLVFVWKDFKKPPMRIEAIPVKSFEPIKHWLNSCDIVFYESTQNILWKSVMKTINEDVEGFWKDGGFDIFLAKNAEDDVSEEDEEMEEEETRGGNGKGRKKRQEESESEFEPDSDEGSDSEEYETPSEEEDSDAEEEYEDDSDESEEDDWDELEKEAAKADKTKAIKTRMKAGSDVDISSGDEEERRRPKKKVPPPRG